MQTLPPFDTVSFDTFIALFTALFAAGALLPVIVGALINRKRLATSLSLFATFLGSIVVVGCAVGVWLQPSQASKTYLLFQVSQEALKIEFKFYADRLSAFFLFLSGVFGLAVVLHLVNWIEDVADDDRHLIASAFSLFVLSIVFTILSDTIYSFLFFQESMTLSFAYLALFRHNVYVRQPWIPSKEFEASKTAFKSYLIFEHVGMMLIAIALVLLSILLPEMGGNFSSLKTSRVNFSTQSEVPIIVLNLVFLFALAGFGIKAGVFPAHIWVTLVHPYSPTSIHAMISGVGLKVAGLYGMYRIFFALEPVQWWWGWLVLLLAGLTTLFGVFFAILAKDLKTALASHSVENIGIILAGIGLALTFNAEEKFALAGLAVIASVYHLLNHSIFKGLLFFCTGAIENRLGVVEMDRLGGLMSRYFVTSFTFLIGSFSIAGLPPFNGFISEWLLLQTIFSAMELFFIRGERIFFLIGLLIVLVCLALAFSLTALAFVKIAGETLLGSPRDWQAVQKSRQGEVRLPMRIVLLTFAMMCFLLGIFPATVIRTLSQLSAELVPRSQGIAQPIVHNGSLILNIPLTKLEQYSQESEQMATEQTPASEPLYYRTRLSRRMVSALAVVVVVSVSAGIVLYSLARKRYLFRAAPPWTCGAPFDSRLMQYRGSVFSSLIWSAFQRSETMSDVDNVIADSQKAKVSVILPYQHLISSRYFVFDPVRQIYNFLLTNLLKVCEWFGLKAQPGDIRVYITYILTLLIFILIGLLVFLGWSPKA